MSDLIEREAAISYAISGERRRADGEDWIRTSEIRQSLLDMPSAQPEIVRCKDCKHWNDEFAKDKSTCWLPCMSMTTHREWHCGSAERRTDE